MELGLEHYEAHSDYGPHVLAQLEADQARLQGQDRNDEYRPIHAVADDVDILCEQKNMSQGSVLGAEFVQCVPI